MWQSNPFSQKIIFNTIKRNITNWRKIWIVSKNWLFVPLEPRNKAAHKKKSNKHLTIWGVLDTSNVELLYIGDRTLLLKIERLSARADVPTRKSLYQTSCMIHLLCPNRSLKEGKQINSSQKEIKRNRKEGNTWRCSKPKRSDAYTLVALYSQERNNKKTFGNIWKNNWLKSAAQLAWLIKAMLKGTTTDSPWILKILQIGLAAYVTSDLWTLSGKSVAITDEFHPVKH